MKSWLLPISMTLGLVGVVAVLLWSLVDWPASERLAADAPIGAVGTSPPPAGDGLTTATGAQTAMREVRRQSATSVSARRTSTDGLGERAVKPLMAEHGYTFPSLIDQTMGVARQFGVRLVPTTYVVNREGVIAGAGFGPLDLTSPAFVQYLEALLSGS